MIAAGNRQGETPEHRDLHGPLLNVRDHRNESRAQRKEQVGTDCLRGRYSEEDQQWCRDGARPTPLYAVQAPTMNPTMM